MTNLFGPGGLGLALLIGAAFSFLLHRGRVTSCNVIVNQFRLKDWTVLKVMLTAIIVGGVGVMVMADAGLAKYAPKDANLLGRYGNRIFQHIPGDTLGTRRRRQ